MSECVTAEQVVGAAPAGSTVTLQLDAKGGLLAWYIRPPVNVSTLADVAAVAPRGSWPGDHAGKPTVRVLTHSKEKPA